MTAYLMLLIILTFADVDVVGVYGVVQGVFGWAHLPLVPNVDGEGGRTDENDSQHRTNHDPDPRR